LKEAFENLTGVKIEGSKSEQRAIVRNASLNLKNGVGIGNEDVKNAPNSSETIATNETTPTNDKNVANGEISVVVDAMKETIKPEALEDFQNSDLKGNFERFAKSVIKFYKTNGTLAAFSDYFVDGGKKVISAIESTMQTTKDTSETKTSENVQKMDENVDVAKSETTISEKETVDTKESDVSIKF
jgi:hypothetical protein